MVGQLRRGVGGVQELAALPLGVELEGVKSLDPLAGGLIDVKLGAAYQFVKVVVAIAPSAALPEAGAVDAVVGEPSLLHNAPPVALLCVAGWLPGRSVAPVFFYG